MDNVIGLEDGTAVATLEGVCIDARLHRGRSFDHTLFVFDSSPIWHPKYPGPKSNSETVLMPVQYNGWREPVALAYGISREVLDAQLPPLHLMPDAGAVIEAIQAVVGLRWLLTAHLHFTKATGTPYSVWSWERSTDPALLSSPATASASAQKGDV